MDWPRYSAHLDDVHGLYQYKNARKYISEDDIQVAYEDWNERDSSSINPRLYDSVDECELSEFESSSEDDDDEPPRLIPLNSKVEPEETMSQNESPSFAFETQSLGESSSDSEDCQSESSSRSNPKKKTASRKGIERSF